MKRHKKKAKLMQDLVKHFEADQQRHGTETAIFNLLWVQYAAQLKSLGIKRVITRGF